MAQRRYHYERAFESYLRARCIPYISVDEARKSLLPDDHEFGAGGAAADTKRALKSFDFLLSGRSENLLVDVKGRRITRRVANAMAPGRLESWVTRDDVESMAVWEKVLGSGFRAAFVFLYLCDAQPPDALFQEIFEHGGRWYAVRVISVADYQAHQRARSARWATVSMPSEQFERLSGSLINVLEPPEVDRTTRRQQRIRSKA